MALINILNLKKHMFLMKIYYGQINIQNSELKLSLKFSQERK